jgi:hypothetical protein
LNKSQPAQQQLQNNNPNKISIKKPIVKQEFTNKIQDWYWRFNALINDFQTWRRKSITHFYFI